jgi:hypothetical protein
METNERVVTSLPLAELWDAAGTLQASKKRYLGSEDIKSLLRVGPIRFVVANVGDKLEWIEAKDCYSFWKQDVSQRLGAEGKVHLEDYPGQYFYFASEWRAESGETIVLLEKQH